MLNKYLKLFMNENTKKYLLIAFSVGVILMLLPSIISNEGNETKKNDNEASSDFDSKVIKNELEKILSNIDGAGKVEVMIVFENNYEKIVAKDTKSAISGEDNNQNREVDSTTVMQKDGNKQIPYVVKEMNPDVRGVLVIAEGAKNPNVRMNIKNAVKTVLDIAVHKVEVLTRKQGG